MAAIDYVGGGMIKVALLHSGMDSCVAIWLKKLLWEDGCKIEKDIFLTLFIQWPLSIDISSGAIKVELLDSVWGPSMDSHEIQKINPNIHMTQMGIAIDVEK